LRRGGSGGCSRIGFGACATQLGTAIGQSLPGRPLDGGLIGRSRQTDGRQRSATLEEMDHPSVKNNRHPPWTRLRLGGSLLRHLDRDADRLGCFLQVTIEWTSLKDRSSVGKIAECVAPGRRLLAVAHPRSREFESSWPALNPRNQCTGVDKASTLSSNPLT
jgi:hypothetical protein